MAKSEQLFNNPLIPWVLIAGVLSGGLWRAAPAPDAGKPGDSGASAERTEGESGPVPWISDLQPVMESLDATLGRATDGSNGSKLPSTTGVALQPKGEARDTQVFQAMATLRTGLDGLISPTEQACGAGTALQAPAATLGAWLLDDDAINGKARATAAKGLLDEYRDWRLLEDLARRTQPDPSDSGAPTYAVDFIVATVPDYVDSNSGWLADQALAALQSGMVHEDFLFDRVKLVDWSRSQAGALSVLASSRLHERQPGAIIFRKVEDKTIQIGKTVQIQVQVVLVVLETPTAGVHQAALRNSLRFLRAWDACATRKSRTLRVLGPSFSGSTLSLATVIGERPFRAAFDPRIVISGSATAGENIQRMKDFSQGAIYRATVQPTAVLQERMARFLESLNPAWKDGDGVALLTESNTAFGGDAGKSGKDAANAATGGGTRSDAFPKAKSFNFPLHIAQLRSDAPALAQPGALLSGPVIPLNMRETVPPSDLIPALRPQLTSPVVGSTVDSILDAIRHEKLSAVGILATDDRDVLFLSREVKRASPDVQLFLFGTHGLYLHPDYVPYLRGALVASSYALTLANQPEVSKSPDPQHRQPFPSMSAEGIFYATRALLSLTPEALGGKPYMLGYCPDGAIGIKDCVPAAPVSINVISEDGYWTITAAASAPTTPTTADGPVDPDEVAPPSRLNVAELPRLPLQFTIGALLVLAIVAIHLVVLYRINRTLTKGTEDQGFLELPFVRMLVPPITFDRAARIHRLTVRVCLGLLALAAAWVEAAALPFLVRGEGVRPMMVVATVVTATVLLVAYAGWHTGPRRRLHPALTLTPPTDAVPPSDSALIRIARRLRSLTPAEIIGWSLFFGMLATMVLFATMVGQALAGLLNGGEWRLTLARLVGGGIVSPAALTVCLAVAFYAAVFMGARRLSLVGYGYSRLGLGSKTFRLFTADPEVLPAGVPRRGSLAAMLDMPAQNMTPFYPLVLLLGIVIAVLATWRVSTIDGRTFSWFLRLGTWTTLGLGLLQLVQGVALWNTARSHLKRLARTPIESRFHEIAAHVPWDISLAPPRLSEFVPVARMADMVVRDFRTLGLASPYTRDDVDLCRNLKDFSSVQAEAESRLGMRRGDLDAAKKLFSPPGYVELLHTEMSTRQHAALIQSDTWLALWRLSDDIVALLEKTAWQRSSIVWCRMEAAELAATGTEGKAVAFPQPPGRFAGGPPQPPTPFDGGPSSEQRDGWFKRCEQLVALEMAFVLRDVVSRTVTCLFAAMLGLTLLTSSHLFYTFNGRAAMVTIDMLAIGATALASVWILVDMERDHVLSRLRSTRPGRIDVNWEFIKRIAVYGVLPLLAVIAALFPEVGGTLFGWLEPLRKLTSF